MEFKFRRCEKQMLVTNTLTRVTNTLVRCEKNNVNKKRATRAALKKCIECKKCSFVCFMF